MKWLYILILATAFFGVQQEAYAEIRNGYEPYALLAEKNIMNLQGLAHDTLSKYHRIRLNRFLKATHMKAEKLKENYERTQMLLEKLRMVDPALYHEINTLRDREGNETHVYIKVVDDLGPRFLGVNNLAQSPYNPHVYTSEYGDHTVSVLVVYPSAARALKILVHELGHVRYQVPHLASYINYYRKYYQNPRYNGKEIGHISNDPSHLSVKATMDTFEKSWRQYYKTRKKLAHDRPRKMIEHMQQS